MSPAFSCLYSALVELQSCKQIVLGTIPSVGFDMRLCKDGRVPESQSRLRRAAARTFHTCPPCVVCDFTMVARMRQSCGKAGQHHSYMRLPAVIQGSGWREHALVSQIGLASVTSPWALAWVLSQTLADFVFDTPPHKTVCASVLRGQTQVPLAQAANFQLPQLLICGTNRWFRVLANR